MRVHPVHYVPSNRLGRDFVVGDVHGCFRTLERALAALEFDASCDRLFGVGDPRRARAAFRRGARLD